MDEVFLLQLASVAVLACLTTYYFLAVAGRSLFPTGTTLFFLWQSIAATGTLLLTHSGNVQTATLRLRLICVGLLFFVAGAKLANHHKGFRPRLAIPVYLRSGIRFDLHSHVFWIVVLGIAAVSIAVGVYYQQRLGYSVVLESLSAYLDVGSLDYSQQVYSLGRRTVHGSAEVYLATGYAMQFFAVLLPLSFCLIYTRSILLGRWSDRVLLFLLVFPTLYLLMLLGIRSLVLSFGLTFALLATRRWGPLGDHARSAAWPATMVLFVIFFYAATTLLAGRSGSGGTIAESLHVPLTDLFNRIVLTASENQLVFLEVVDESRFRFGKGWLDSLAILLPGWERGIGSQLAPVVGRSASTSVPPDFWTSVWWNFGWGGILIVPLLTGYLLQRYTIFFFTGERILSRIVIIYYSFFIFREVGEPIVVFNRGFVTVLIFYGIIVITKVVARVAFPGNIYEWEIPAPRRRWHIPPPRRMLLRSPPRARVTSP